MRAAFLIFIFFYALFHSIGFVKSFGFSEIQAIAIPITKPMGLLWLLACLLFIILGISYALHYKFWWIIGIVSVIISQFLIISFWQDAKFGTIPNILILLVSVIGLFNYNFSSMVKNELELMNASIPTETLVFTEKLIEEIPKPVQKWLLNTGIVGKPIIKNVHLHQNFRLKMKPEQKNWYSAKAEQFFTIDNPAFIWTINMQLIPLLSVKGRDKFSEGKGAMLIKVLSIVPVVDEKNNEKLNEGTLQRFLGEIIWFPSAAISSHITWEAIDDHSAKATLNYQGNSGSGIFHFNESGDFVKFSAMRYMGSGDKAQLREWDHRS